MSQWMISAVELLAFLPMFVAGFGCGFYVRNRILEKRRSRYLVKPYIVQETAARRHPERDHIRENPSLRPAVPNRVRSVGGLQPSEPDGEKEIAAPLPLDFNTVRMSDELRALLKLLPPEGRTKGS
jgi:hypothetical protein